MNEQLKKELGRIVNKNRGYDDGYERGWIDCQKLYKGREQYCGTMSKCNGADGCQNCEWNEVEL